jgi:3-deoxy-manno-octulosonate cytidylyltransferase (CMP-KDO synthetase)
MELVAAAVIPARYGSTRFPGKPLVKIAGLPLVEHVWRRTCQASAISRVIVATDDERIREVVEAFGRECIMTSPDHPSGSDRLGEVAGQLDADVIVNVQGDEPLIDPAVIDQVVAPFVGICVPDIATAAAPITSDDEYISPHVVKVVLDKAGNALYFSRSPIPAQPGGNRPAAFRHIGIYAYGREALLRFVSLQESVLEKAEKLEQLRALENGMTIRVVEVKGDRGMGVDRPEDVEKVEKILQEEAV